MLVINTDSCSFSIRFPSAILNLSFQFKNIKHPNREKAILDHRTTNELPVDLEVLQGILILPYYKELFRISSAALVSCKGAK
jgi:hypothetical protein